MKNLKFIDTTLRISEGLRSRELSFKEKIEIARILDRLKADTIELPPIAASKANALANRTIASMTKTRISAAVELSADDIEASWESVCGAEKAKLNLLVPVSPVQMEYVCHKKGPAILEAAVQAVKRGRALTEHVEFSAVDATRAEPDFLYQILTAVIEAGANKVTLCDTAGAMLPDEFGSFVQQVFEHVPAMQNIELYVEVSDALHMALACSIAAVQNGAAGVKCAAVESGIPTVEQLSAFVQAKGDALQLSNGMRSTEMHRAVEQLSAILLPAKGERSRFANVTLDDATNVTLSASDEIGAVNRAVAQLGYDLDEEDLAKVYEAFCRVASKKQFVGSRELDAIVASTALQVPSAYRIRSYVINSGNVITATANLLLEREGAELRGVGIGDGPIDAAFQAIEQIVGHHYELDDFQIQTVTEGRDAMGSAFVKLRAGGKVYAGTGISTDIIGAAIRAYISALNKIIYENG